MRDHNEELGLYVGGIVPCIPNQSISHDLILQNMEECHHWEYRGIEAGSHLGPTIRNILVAPTRPLQFI